MYSHYHNGMMHSSVEAFRYHFLPRDQVGGKSAFQTRTQSFAFLEHSVRHYYSLEEVLPGVFRCWPSPHLQTSPTITVYFANTANRSHVKCLLTQNMPRGPFGHCGENLRNGCPCLPQAIDSVRAFEVELSLVTTPPWLLMPWGTQPLKCFQWDLTQRFTFDQNTGLITVKLDWDYNECSAIVLQHSRPLVFVGGLLCLLLVLFWCSLADLALRVGALRARSGGKRAYDGFIWRILRCGRRAEDDDLGAPCFLLKMSLGWILWGIMADLITAAFAVSFVFVLWIPASSTITYLRWALLGLGSSSQFILLSCFFEHDPLLFLLLNALSAAAPVLGAFFLSVLPVFMAFTLFGTAVFGMHSTMFQTAGQAAATLFAMMNGDSITAAFASTANGGPVIAVLSPVYFVSFILVVLYVVTNIARVIIIQAYGQVREQLNVQRDYSIPPGRSMESSTAVCPQPSYVEYFDIIKLVRITLTLALCALFTVHVAYNSGGQNLRLYHTELLLKREFLPSSTSGRGTASFYSTKEVTDHISLAGARYFRLESLSPDFLELPRDSEDRPIPPVLEVEYLPESPVPGIRTLRCPLSVPQSSVGTVAEVVARCERVQGLDKQMRRAKLNFTVRTHPTDDLQHCVEWSGALLYDFSQRTGVVPVTLDLDYGSCGANRPAMLESPRLWVPLLILLITAVKTALNSRHTYRAVLVSNWQRYRMFTMAANLLWFFENYAFIYLLGEPQVALGFHRIALGIVCCLNWGLVIAHLESQPAHRYLGETLRRALPIAGNFALGSLPLFLGYCMFATVFFGHISAFFADLSTSAVTLFGILNGDIVLDVLSDLHASDSHLINLLAVVFFYSFIPLMIYGMLNLFLVITEEAYRAVAERDGVT